MMLKFNRPLQTLACTLLLSSLPHCGSRAKLTDEQKQEFASTLQSSTRGISASGKAKKGTQANQLRTADSRLSAPAQQLIAGNPILATFTSAMSTSSTSQPSYSNSPSTGSSTQPSSASSSQSSDPSVELMSTDLESNCKVESSSPQMSKSSSQSGFSGSTDFSSGSSYSSGSSFSSSSQPAAFPEQKYSITASGEKCPISLAASFSMKFDTSNPKSLSANAGLTVDYKVVQESFRKYNDVDSFNLTVNVDVTGNQQGGGEMTLSGNGNIHSQVKGDIKLTAEGKISGDDKNVDGGFTFVTTFPTFVVELEMKIAKGTDGKPTLEYVLNGEKMTEQEVSKYFAGLSDASQTVAPGASIPGIKK